MPAMSSNTIYGIITDAMMDAGYLQEGQKPNSQQLSDNARKLCDLVNLWQTQGLKLFLNKVLTIPLVDGQSDYSLGPAGDVVMARPLRIFEANIVTPQNIRRPLVVMAWEEWMRLGQVNGNKGTVSSYMVDKQNTQTVIKLWNTPDAVDATNTLEVLAQVQAPNPWNLEEDSYFPPEWRIALRWGLADEICTGQPEAIMARCAARAAKYRTDLEDFDVEDAPMTFAMDARNSYFNRFPR